MGRTRPTVLDVSLDCSRTQDFIKSIAGDVGVVKMESFFTSSAWWKIKQVKNEGMHPPPPPSTRVKSTDNAMMMIAKQRFPPRKTRSSSLVAKYLQGTPWVVTDSATHRLLLRGCCADGEFPVDRPALGDVNWVSVEISQRLPYVLDSKTPRLLSSRKTELGACQSELSGLEW